MRRCRRALLGLILAVPVFGQATPPAAAPPILQGATLPMYPPIAKAAHITGKVVVRVTVKDGLVVKTDVRSGQRFLESPTVENLKTWRFAADVTGEYTMTYTYEISGEASEQPTNAKVEILPLSGCEDHGASCKTDLHGLWSATIGDPSAQVALS
jgi:hypothetical protein